jgi:hypothetical protein
MHRSLKRLAALAALGTVGVVAPVSSASAAVPPNLAGGFALPQLPLTGLPAAGLGLPGGLPALPGGGAGLAGFNPAGLSFTGPSVGMLAAVIGPTVITTAPSTFNNTNIQVSAGSNATGGQAGP